MPTADEIKSASRPRIPGARAEVEDWTGGGDHFRATRASPPQFAGLSRIAAAPARLRRLRREIGGPIHALSLKTRGPT